jgi:hypothetical protein
MYFAERLQQLQDETWLLVLIQAHNVLEDTHVKHPNHTFC